jgi:hypothetical protein
MRFVVDRKLLKAFWDFSREDLGIREEQDGEKWVDSDILDKHEPGFGETCSAMTNQVELPSPLWYMDFDVIARQDGIVQYAFSVGERDESAFKNRSIGFSRRVSSLKLNFFPTSPNLTGYVMNADNDVIADISDNEEGDARRISFGRSGSRIRKYKDYQTFAGEVGELEALAERFVAHCLGKNASIDKRLFDTNLYFGLEMDN